MYKSDTIRIHGRHAVYHQTSARRQRKTRGAYGSVRLEIDAYNEKTTTPGPRSALRRKLFRPQSPETPKRPSVQPSVADARILPVTAVLDCFPCLISLSWSATFPQDERHPNHTIPHGSLRLCRGSGNVHKSKTTSECRFNRLAT